MNYNEAREYIKSKSGLGIIPGLDSVKGLLKRLGNPQDNLKCFHISGTNGKGSVFAYLEQILLEAGYKIGRFSSPYVFEYLEQFRINGRDVYGETFSEAMICVRKANEDMEKEEGFSATSFELETAAAFVMFADAGVDYVLLECGMGGREDSTNVLKENVTAVIASVGMDHMSFLGDKVEEILQHKLGIVKDNGTCIVAPQTYDVVNTIISEYCKENRVKLTLTNRTDYTIIESDYNKTVFKYRDKLYEIHLLGLYQVDNAITALECADAIGISYEDKYQGLRNTIWNGRFMKISDDPLIFIDGAHNEDAWKKLSSTVQYYFTNRKLIYIIGVLKDKQYNKMIDILGGDMFHVITVTPDNPRALDNSVLLEAFKDRGIDSEKAESNEQALSIAKSICNSDSVIIVCGTLSILKDYI